ncbi:uncharacterized protein T48 [Anabrus simplex]|uniref:uncharacterized protein T48 n=1 Tax=Anabrus simplex TaxID=316456 RepID=UPI0035A33390
MGWARSCVSIGIWILLVGVMNAPSVIGEGPSCDGQKDCIKCEKDDEESPPRCMKCTRFIVLGSRQCVDECPSGYREEWSSLVDYMGKICREISYMGLPGRTLAVIVGTCSGAALCMGVLLGGFLYLRHRRHRAVSKIHQQAEDITDTNLREPEDTPERREFLKHLATLRCEAPIFLAMLNDTRRQVRELHHPNNTNDSAIQAYRPVLRDLARILTLLNRSEDQILSPPVDWETLLAWGERVLRRYKKQNPHQVAQAQLVSFLQVPIQTNPSSPVTAVDYQTSRRELTTFQPFNGSSSVSPNSINKNSNNNSSTLRTSNQSLQELAISTFNSNYNNAPMANSFNNSNDVVLRRDAALLQPSLIDSNNEFNPCWEFNPQNYTILAEWSASRDYLVDDDFFTLGFRPQDEITTEL